MKKQLLSTLVLFLFTMLGFSQQKHQVQAQFNTICETLSISQLHLSQVQLYPNPVKETYNGTIAIKGLPANAEVRITDVTGMLVYQTQAFGGQAVWDGRDYTGRKAKTGVYLVFSVNEEGTESKPTKLLFIK